MTMDEIKSIGKYPNSEIVFGLTYAVGTDYSGVLNTLRSELEKYSYAVNQIRFSNLFSKHIKEFGLDVQLSVRNEHERIRSRMLAGNALREKTQMKEFAALIGASQIHTKREFDEKHLPKPYPRTAHVLLSLKRPEEVDVLRRTYGAGFFLIGIFATEPERLEFLKSKGIETKDAEELIAIDREEANEYGQKTRDTFHLADVFVTSSGEKSSEELKRFIELVFGHPFHTPTPDEHGMFLAYSASLRSADLSRQVGAALFSPDKDLLAVGCNDVPKSGGGLYWPGVDDQRDFRRCHDANETEKLRIAKQIIGKFGHAEPASLAEAKKFLEGTEFFDITEFGRTVHAEMDALLTCARTGVSTTNGTLYTTTFPCHNCTRHLIAAGIRRVVFIEPYPKSKAFELHNDAVVIDGDKSTNRVDFGSFVGIGPRRYFDLFSLFLSTGYPIVRKRDGKCIHWESPNAEIRIPMKPTSYLNNEEIVQVEVLKIENPEAK